MHLSAWNFGCRLRIWYSFKSYWKNHLKSWTVFNYINFCEKQCDIVWQGVNSIGHFLKKSISPARNDMKFWNLACNLGYVFAKQGKKKKFYIILKNMFLYILHNTISRWDILSFSTNQLWMKFLHSKCPAVTIKFMILL